MLQLDPFICWDLDITSALLCNNYTDSPYTVSWAVQTMLTDVKKVNSNQATKYISDLISTVGATATRPGLRCGKTTKYCDNVMHRRPTILQSAHYKLIDWQMTIMTIIIMMIIMMMILVVVVIPRFSVSVWRPCSRGELTERGFRDASTSSGRPAVVTSKSSMPVGDDQRAWWAGVKVVDDGVDRGSPDTLRLSASDDWSISDGSGLARGASGLAGRTVTVSQSSTPVDGVSASQPVTPRRRGGEATVTRWRRRVLVARGPTEFISTSLVVVVVVAPAFRRPRRRRVRWRWSVPLSSRSAAEPAAASAHRRRCRWATAATSRRQARRARCST